MIVTLRLAFEEF